jgi:hypothetical protein
MRVEIGREMIDAPVRMNDILEKHLSGTTEGLNLTLVPDDLITAIYADMQGGKGNA